LKLGTIFRHDTEAELAPDPELVEHMRQVREKRLETARGRVNWTELPETRLVRRGPFWVDAETDLVWVVRRGHVFEPGRASVGYVTDDTPMTFFVDATDEVVFIEPSGGRPRTWSEVVAKRAKRGSPA
jgi:hypothetical protein